MPTVIAHNKPKKSNKRSYSSTRNTVETMQILEDSRQIEALRQENETLRQQVHVLQLKNEGRIMGFEALTRELKAHHASKLKELEDVIRTQQVTIETLKFSLRNKLQEPKVPNRPDEQANSPQTKPTSDAPDSKEIPITLESSFSKSLASHHLKPSQVQEQDIEMTLDTVRLKDLPTLHKGAIAEYRKTNSEEGRRKEFFGQLSAKLSQFLSSQA